MRKQRHFMRRCCVPTVLYTCFAILLLAQKSEPFAFSQPARRPFAATDANVKYIRQDEGNCDDEFTILNGNPIDTNVKSVLKSVENILAQQQRNVITRGIDKSAIAAKLNKRHDADCDTARVFAVEGDASSTDATPPNYEWIYVNEDYPLAVQSLVPILTATQVSTLERAAEDYWSKADSGTSRFTYQRVGNSEAHVCDLGQDATNVMNDVLLESIYPLIRSAFYTNDNNASNLCVYDALLIRYNATAANNPLGAGQPLHRDLGIASVNIMLNGQQDEFEGGGTFFENQLRNESSVVPLKPLGEGYCLAHLSSERHAGAATVSGVRNVLVVFVMARQENGVAPPLIQNARLKQSARRDCQEMCGNDTTCIIMCRIQHQLMAIEAVPHDGEAFQYLGTALMDLMDVCDYPERNTILNAAVDCLRHAACLTPCDSRAYSNLGLALSRRHSTSLADESSDVGQAYEKSLEILAQSRAAGCDIEDEWDIVSLNYGLFLSNMDRFRDSILVLDRTARKKEAGGIEMTTMSQVVDDAHRLWQFCKRNVIE